MATYFNSSKVKVFPCAYRNYESETVYNPESRLITENNFTNIYGKTFNKGGYIISLDQDTTTLTCNIGGYYFEINADLSGVKKLGIALTNYNYGNETTYLLCNPTGNEGEGSFVLDDNNEFKGLSILDINETLSSAFKCYYLILDPIKNSAYHVTDLLQITDTNGISFNKTITNNGTNTLVLGDGNTISGENSLLIADNINKALNNSIVLGDSVILGNNIENYGIAIGKNIIGVDKAIVIGENLKAGSMSQILLGNKLSASEVADTNKFAIYANEDTPILSIDTNKILHVSQAKIETVNSTNANVTTSLNIGLINNNYNTSINTEGITTNKITIGSNSINSDGISTNNITSTNMTLNGGDLTVTNYLETKTETIENSETETSEKKYFVNITAQDGLKAGKANITTITGTDITVGTVNATSASIDTLSTIGTLTIKNDNNKEATITFDSNGNLVISC